MSKLDDILTQKRLEIEGLKRLFNEEYLTTLGYVPSFLKAVRKRHHLSVIAEIKRKSPSLGEINMDDDPIKRAKQYEESGADAISVLTDEKFFGGSFSFLNEVSRSIDIPTLCKDFVLDKIQIDMAKARLASAVLLIADVLSDETLADLYGYANSIGLDVLLEAHGREHIKRAAQLNPAIIGINNRNLVTMEEDVTYSLGVVSLLPESSVKLSLSSFTNREEAIRVAEVGFDGVLVGSALMKAYNTKAALKSFLDIPKP